MGHKKMYFWYRSSTFFKGIYLVYLDVSYVVYMLYDCCVCVCMYVHS